MIISASRRTDIPCFYSEWFMNRLKAGYVLSKNPMNPAQIKRISLSPNDVDCIVFWTKDPQNMLDKLPDINQMGYRYYFQFTLNPYGRELERNLRDKADIVQTFVQLAEHIGSRRLIWRYDPIVINDRYTVEYHIKSFEALCSHLQGSTNRCIISFVDNYRKLKGPVREHIIRDIGEELQQTIAGCFAKIADSYGIELMACCEQAGLAAFGLKASACIDKGLIESICGYPLKVKRDKNQRPGCNCAESVDIGVYNSCSNGCLYCYANHSETSIRKNIMRHDPEADILI